MWCRKQIFFKLKNYFHFKADNKKNYKTWQKKEKKKIGIKHPGPGFQGRFEKQ